MRIVCQESFEISFPISALTTSLKGIVTEPRLTFKSQMVTNKIVKNPNVNGYENFFFKNYLFKNVINFRIAIPL